MFTVQQEIEERQKFLSEMESLGRGEKYRNIIATEISQVWLILKLASVKVLILVIFIISVQTFK